MLAELREKRLLGNKPLSFLEIPRSLIPLRNGEQFGLYKHRMHDALKYMASLTDIEDIKKALTNYRDFAFRGKTRPKDHKFLNPDRPWHNLLGALENISLHGIDKVPPCKIWFAFGDPVYGIAASVPQIEEELGILIVSRGRGMECLTDDYESDGVEPVRGNTFKSLHIATIVYLANESA